MHSDDMQARYNHMNLVRNHHQSRMHPASQIDYDYVPYVVHTSRRDHMYKTRCYTRIRTRSRRTWVSSRLITLILY